MRGSKPRLLQAKPAQLLLPVTQEILPARLKYGARTGQGSLGFATDQQAARSEGCGGSRRGTESGTCEKGTAGVGVRRDCTYLVG
jgi:hypothetical protein